MANTKNTMDISIAADMDALNAYQVLFYDFENVLPIANWKDESVDITPTDWSIALTVEANMKGTGYALSNRSVAALAYLYALARKNGCIDMLLAKDDNGNAAFDPAGDIRVFVPSGKFKPMYPDFPTQVLSMSEAEFRIDQMLHYMSTYGVKALFSMFEIDVEVTEGYMPDVESTEKTRTDEKLVEDKVVELILSRDDMFMLLADDVRRPKRMSDAAINMLCKLMKYGFPEDFPTFAFHENMNEVVLAVSRDGSSNDIATACKQFCLHAGDVLKAIAVAVKANAKNHLTTKQKKGFCRALEAFDANGIAHNIADASKKGETAINHLSVARFGGASLKDAVELVGTRKIVSFNSVLEKKWSEYEKAIGSDKVGACEDALLDMYAQRPGMMLRALSRLIMHGVDAEKIVKVLAEHSEEFSLATLVTLCANMSADDTHVMNTWRGAVAVSDEAEAERRKRHAEANAVIATIAAQLIAMQFEKLTTTFQNKKVFIDEGSFSLDGSVILPNAQGDTANAYPPAGMAYKIPDEGVVRFFTFWNQDRPTVDVDTHFRYVDTSGCPGHIGWNSNFRNDGMVFSGDITTSHNSAEYLDVDIPVAKKNGVDTIYCNQHIYSGEHNWKDIDECFCGALLVGDTEPDVALYHADNILFHDDMNGEGRKMEYSMIDITNNFVRILRGVKLPFTRCKFTARVYVNMLLEAQHAIVVDNEEEADVIVSVGRRKEIPVDENGNEKELVCLIDEKFFIE